MIIYFLRDYLEKVLLFVYGRPLIPKSNFICFIILSVHGDPRGWIPPLSAPSSEECCFTVKNKYFVSLHVGLYWLRQGEAALKVGQVKK